MSTLLETAVIDRAIDKRLRISWGRKTTPLKHSNLFNKAKHSEEWHQSIDATAGVLQPSDPKFPYTFLRAHTDAYLSKKNKINQTDTDIRLAILIGAHDTRHIAVAAAAHAMSAMRLRDLLLADINVMHGSYFGLKSWLQCLIAANNGNPASVTDMEARWARILIPFAMQGSRAAEWYLIGICQALRRDACISDMGLVPEHAVLMRRAIADYFARLEGYKVRCQWAEAYDTVLWMKELARTSPATTPPDHLLPEQILDSEMPLWRIWTYWKPDTDRIKSLSQIKTEWHAIMPELVALEGPDMITGTQDTLREGLIARYVGAKAFLKWRGVIVEVPGGTKRGLRSILERLGRALDILIGDATCPSMFNLFKELILTRPITVASLDIFEATCSITHTPDKDAFNAVREICANKEKLGMCQLSSLQRLAEACSDEKSEQLRCIFLQDWLWDGIERCVQECQQDIQKRMYDGTQWTNLALDYNNFCLVVRASEHYWPIRCQTMRMHPRWLSRDELKVLLEIYEAAKAQRSVDKQTITCGEKQVHGTLHLHQHTSRPSTATEGDGHSDEAKHALEGHVEAYIIERLLAPGRIANSSQDTMMAVLKIWEITSTPDDLGEVRELMLILSNHINSDAKLLCECLAEITRMQQAQAPGTFIETLIRALRHSTCELSQAIIALVKLLAEFKTRKQCWNDLLYMWIEEQSKPSYQGQDVLAHSLDVMKLSDWLSFMTNIEYIFGDFVFLRATDGPSPLILRLAVLGWRSQLSVYTNTLVRLEQAHGTSREPIRFIVTQDSQADSLVAILDYLKKTEGKRAETIMQKAVGKLSIQAQNHLAVKECLRHLSTASTETIDCCGKIWDASEGFLNIPGLPEPQPVPQNTAPGSRGAIGKAVLASMTASFHVAVNSHDTVKDSKAAVQHTQKRRVPPAVVEVMVTGWLLNDDLSEQDKSAVASVAVLLGICVDKYGDDAWSSTIIEAMVFWEGIENEIIQEAAGLEELQNAMLTKDRQGTKLLLRDLGVQSTSALDDELASLPAGLIDVVEKVADDQVEISFPLAALTVLQRSAQGIPDAASSLVVRYQPNSNDESSPCFCIHFNNENVPESVIHTPWRCSSESGPPHENFCSAVQTVYVWQLNRIIHTWLKSGQISIEKLHTMVTATLQKMGYVCVSCGASHNADRAQLRRATPCNILACARLWYQLPLEVRIPEIKTDVFVVDAMLTAVYAAAMSGRAELLPGCPVYGLENVKAVLNALPKLSTLKLKTDLSKTLSQRHHDAEKLVSWACVHHRGFIATATGLCKIPTMPAGTHQFILANASPKIEHDFVSALPRYNPQTTVLFHGTTFDRLPAILAQGLKVKSGTSLQRTGAAHGKGIYLADEPSFSLGYAPATTSWRNSGLTNMRLLLGCEVAGAGRSVGSGIHVVTDEKSVIVRYIFFLTSQASSPVRNHVVPAIASAISALRIGAI